MYESFLIGFVGAIAGSLLTGRNFKGALQEKVSLTYDVTTRVHQQVAAIGLEQKHFESRIGSNLGEISKLANHAVTQIEKADQELNDNKSLVSALEKELNDLRGYRDEENEEYERVISGLQSELNEAKQTYVEMATKANEEIGKLQGTVTTYHNALMEASRKNQELSVGIGMQKGN